MGNTCCAGENSQADNDNNFRLNTQGSVQRESLNDQGRGDLQGMGGNRTALEGSVTLNDEDHLPKTTNQEYMIYTQQFPPTLTPDAIKCEGTLPNLPPPLNQPGDMIYPTSTNAYLIKSNQELYKGQFYNQKPHGFGEMYTPTNEANAPNSGLETVKRGNTVAAFGGGTSTGQQDATYSSDPTVLGSMTFIKYVGSFKDGQKSGYGRATYPDGSVYMGEWLNNLPHGKGKLKSLPVNN